VRRERVKWLWPGYIPLGKLTIIDGDPGVGKSSFTLDLAARVSTNRPMPDGSRGLSADVILVGQEDGLADTIRPRLEAMQGNAGKVRALTDRHGIVFPRDAEVLKAVVTRHQAKLVVIDPLMAHIDAKHNTWSDQQVRAALLPLQQVAQETGCALVVVRHLNKRVGAPAMQRGGGSIGIIGAARMGFLIGRNPANPDCRVLASVKCNLGPQPTSLGFRLKAARNGAARIQWVGASQLTADALIAEGNNTSKLDEAKEFLTGRLSAGAKPAKHIQAAAFEAGISEKTLMRAKKSLGVESEKQGTFEDGQWDWSLPETHRRPDTEGLQSEHASVKMTTLDKPTPTPPPNPGPEKGRRPKKAKSHTAPRRRRRRRSRGESQK
jgi:hypothetical protein